MKYGASLLTGAVFLSIMIAPCYAGQPLSITVQPDRRGVLLDDRIQDIKKLSRIPGNASLTGNEEWSAQRAATIKDITDYIPGVFSQPRNGAESARLSVRGSGLTSNFQGRGLMVMQDGIPITMADGEFEFPMIDPWLSNYVEIYPGANALAFGGSTLGGAIDFITPNGQTDPGYEMRAEGGSFGTVHAQATAGINTQDKDVFAAATAFSQNGFRDHNRQQTARFNANMGWRPDDEFTTRLYVSHIKSDAKIPGAISRNALKDDPRQANPNNILGDYERNLDITRLASRSVWENGPQRVSMTLFYTYRTLDNPVTTYLQEYSNDAGMQFQYASDLGLDEWVSGLNIYYGTADETRYRNIDGDQGPRILDRDLNAITTEIYGQYEKNIVENLYAIGGAQASYATRDIYQDTPDKDTQTEDFFGFNPRIGLRYDLTTNTNLFTNLSRSFEPPTLSELSGGNAPGFKRLDAQTGTTFEAGFRGQRGDMAWSAALYRSWLQDEFVNYRFDDGTSDTINANKTLHDGFELGMNGALTHSLTMRLAYSWNHFRLQDDPLYGDNQLPGIPEHYIRAELLHKTGSGFSFGPNLEWVPQGYPVDLTNSLNTSEYALLGARGFWESTDKNFNVYIEGRNLADRHYIATSNVIPDAAGNDGRYFYPGEGRAFYAGLKWKL